MSYILANTLNEALGALSNDVTVLAGGTDVFPAATVVGMPDKVLDITGVKELRGISETDEAYRFGALTTWSDVARAELPAQFDTLKLAAIEIGSIQIQNAGTLAGNLCNASPAADGVPPLLTLNASVELASPNGIRCLALADFIFGNRRTALEAQEMVTAILIPKDIDQSVSHFIKLGARKYLVISIAMVSVVLETDPSGSITQARIAVGACSEVAQRLPDVEKALVGIPAQEAATAVQLEQFDHLSPISDVRATKEYRKNAAVELVKRALDKCAEKLS